MRPAKPAAIFYDVKLCERTGVPQDIQQLSPGDAKNILHDRRKLKSMRLQKLLQPIDVAAALLDKTAVQPRAFPQIPYGRGRDKALFQKTVTQQRCDPLRIPHIGFPAGQIPHVVSVYHPDVFQVLGTEFHGLKDRLPVYAGALHGNRIAIVTGKPQGQSFQFRFRCSKAFSDSIGFKTFPMKDASLDQVFVHVQSAAAVQ